MNRFTRKIPLIVGILVFVGFCVAYKAQGPEKPQIEREITAPVGGGAVIQLNLSQKAELKDLILKHDSGQLTFSQAQKLIQYMNLQKAGQYKVRNDLLPQMMANLKIKANQ